MRRGTQTFSANTKVLRKINLDYLIDDRSLKNHDKKRIREQSWRSNKIPTYYYQLKKVPIGFTFNSTCLTGYMWGY